VEVVRKSATKGKRHVDPATQHAASPANHFPAWTVFSSPKTGGVSQTRTASHVVVWLYPGFASDVAKELSMDHVAAKVTSNDPLHYSNRLQNILDSSPRAFHRRKGELSVR
jgi:hypothetical protein